MKKILVLPLVLIIAYLAFPGYSGAIKNEIEKQNSQLTPCIVGKKALPLDESTAPVNIFLTSDTICGKDKVLFFNENNRKLYCYDYNSAKLEWIFPESSAFDKDYQGFAISEDRGKVLMFDYDNSSIDAYDLSTGKLTHTVNYPPAGKIKGMPMPYSGLSVPIYERQGKIYAAGLTGEYPGITKAKDYCMTALDLNTGKLLYGIEYPWMYKKYNWSDGLLFKTPYWCMDDSGRIIISFPADNDITVCDPSLTEGHSYYGGSSKVSEIRPFRKKRGITMSNPEEWKHYVENPTYEGISYDRYRQLYYRVVRMPWSDYKTGEYGNKKPIGIIVLDHNFNIVGEAVLPNLPEGLSYYPYNFFATSEGLNIQVLNGNDDAMLYYCFNFAVQQ